MIPLTLNVRNFMSYTDVHEPLRFEGIHVAVLTGANGHGKSALLDAITWALWGRTRARAVDELIHTGTSDMEVEFEFALDDCQYRVIRKRQRRGKGGTSDLQFAVKSEDGSFKPLTERSVTETERAIERTLRMSYDTFVNSSFIQQGRADNFTTNSATERKRILAEILELGLYDELEARAKERFKTREAQLSDERRLEQGWAEEIARRPAYQAELDRLRAELANLDDRVGHLDEAVTSTRDAVTQLEHLHQQLEETAARLARFTQDRDRARGGLAERLNLRTQAQQVLDRGEEVERAAAELDRLRRALEVMTQRQADYLPLERVRQATLRTVSAEGARLEGEVHQYERRLAEMRTAVERLPALRTELTRAQAEAKTLAGLEHEQSELQGLVTRAREEAAEKRTINTQLRKEMFELKAQLDELEALSTCPTCQRSMDAQHKKRLRDRYMAEGTRLRDAFRANEGVCRQLDGTITNQQALLARASEALAGREAILRRSAQAESRLTQAEEAQRELTRLQRELDDKQRQLTTDSFAAEARSQLVLTEQRIAALAYDEDQHAQLRQRVTELNGVDAERQLLEQARLSIGHLDAQIKEMEDSLRRLEEECTADEERCTQLGAQTLGLASQRQRLADLTALAAEAHRTRDGVRDQCVFAQTKLDNCAFLERKQRDSLARQDGLRREMSIYGDLAYAFGHRGVQAMIIETAIPEIEEEANRILARMTDGRMYVKFETQRDVRSGLGTIETLDIRISDELGTRSYEMFSGGESFRVNFAIRIALSRLLAHRAGTRLQLLVVDEGFGSQDLEGRDRIVEAIQTIESEFEKILVITHLEDLRERFPVRIEVSKTPEGSVYALR